MTGTARIIRGDARSLPLADNSVDLVVTSPPYFALRSYTDRDPLCDRCRELSDGWIHPGDAERNLREAWPDWDAHVAAEHNKPKHYDGQIGSEQTPTEYVDELIDVTRECVRVLKPSGSLWVNLGDKYNSATSNTNLHRPDSRPAGGVKVYTGARGSVTQEVRPKSLMGIPWRYVLRCIDQLGLILRAEVIWSKPNGLPESVQDRVRRSHEQFFHFTLQPRYFSAVDEIREEHQTAYATKSWLERRADGAPTRYGEQAIPVPVGHHALGKLPGSVWTIPTEPLTVPAHLGVDHFAAFPLEWPRRIIRGWCPLHGAVLDPFGGTGTAALAAKALGRTGIHLDMSADYNRIARWRTTDRDQLAKAMQVTRSESARDADLYDMEPLFGGIG